MTEQDLEMWRKTLDLPMLRWRKDEMQPLIDLLPDGAYVAELGVFAGESSVQFLRSRKVAYLLCVDTWKAGYEERGQGFDVASDSDMSVAYFAFDQRMASVPGGSARYTVIAGTTLEAARGLGDGPFFDLVYIDADHRYEAVKADIEAWLPKIKPGGILAGHDYSNDHPGVRKAVNGFLLSARLPAVTFPDTSWAVRV
jgi:hypothetical protein